MARIRRLLTPGELERWDALYAGLGTAPPCSQPPPRLRCPAAHAALLVDAGILRPIETCPSNAWCVDYFAVVETKWSAGDEPAAHVTVDNAPPATVLCDRLRPIMWPKSFLEHSAYDANLSLPRLPDIRNVVRTRSSAVVPDVASAFWHLPAGGCFAMQDSLGNWYLIDRLMFGIDAASELCQLAVNAVARHAASGLDIDLLVYIDGVLAAADDDSITSLWLDKFQRTCDDTHLLLNTVTPPSQQVVFCGARLDLTGKTVALSARFMVKLARLGIPAANAVVTAGDAEALMARLIYAGAVLALPLHAWWLATKWSRRLASALAANLRNRNESLSVPPSVAADLASLFAAVAVNVPVSAVAPPRDGFWTSPRSGDGDPEPLDGVVFTDATPVGFGAVFAAVGEVPVAYGGKFARQLPIAVAETAAVALGLSHFGPAIAARAAALRRPLRIVLLIDNTTTLHGIDRVASGRRLPLQHAPLLTTIDNIAAQLPMLLSVGYVPTRQNIADAPSRGRPIGAAELIAADSLLRLATPIIRQQAMGQRMAPPTSNGCRRRLPPSHVA